jgi:hypothetical protein
VNNELPADTGDAYVVHTDLSQRMLDYCAQRVHNLVAAGTTLCGLCHVLVAALFRRFRLTDADLDLRSEDVGA